MKLTRLFHSLLKSTLTLGTLGLVLLPNASAGFSAEIFGSGLIPLSKVSTVTVDPTSLLIHSVALSKTTLKVSNGYGGGLMFLVDIMKPVGIEIGASYFIRTYSIGTILKNHLNFLSVPLGVRMSFTFPVFVAVGGYLNHFITNSGKLTGENLGIYGGVGTKLSLGHRMALLIRADYRHALQAVLTQDEFLGSLGLTFDI